MLGVLEVLKRDFKFIVHVFTVKKHSAVCVKGSCKGCFFDYFFAMWVHWVPRAAASIFWFIDILGPH